MATMTLRGLDEQLKQRLSLRAASHGRSMEDEAREILRTALAQEEEEGSLVEAIRSRIEPFGGVKLQIAPREGMPDAPRLET